MAKKRNVIRAPKKVALEKPSESEFRQLSRVGEDTRKHVSGTAWTLPKPSLLPRVAQGLLVNIFSDPEVADDDVLYLVMLLRVILQDKENNAAIELAITMAKERAEAVKRLRMGDR